MSKTSGPGSCESWESCESCEAKTFEVEVFSLMPLSILSTKSLT